jgi:hypothetical protein
MVFTGRVLFLAVDRVSELSEIGSIAKVRTPVKIKQKIYGRCKK